MNKTISTRTGLLTGLLILFYLLLLQKFQVAANSPLVLVQFGLLFVGILISCYLLYKYYAGISYIEAFTHCGKTAAMIIVITVLGNAILYFVFTGKDSPISNLTFIIMKTIFAYGLSGLLSSFFSSYIFHTFTKK
jgi:hypothetical protein